MPVTKHNFIVKDVHDLADTVRKAFYIANEGRKGPVLIDIPKDITAAKCEFTPKQPQKPVNHNPEDIGERIAQAAEPDKVERTPFIYAGGGVVSCSAEAEPDRVCKSSTPPFRSR